MKIQYLVCCVCLLLMPSVSLATMANPPASITVNGVEYANYIGVLTVSGDQVDCWALSAAYTAWGDGGDSAQAVIGGFGNYGVQEFEFMLSFNNPSGYSSSTPAEDGSNWPSGWSITGASSPDELGTNVVVVAPVTNGMWETVISGGVDGSTNVIQINIKMDSVTNLLSLLYGGQESGGGSVFLDQWGSVFKDQSDISWLYHQNDLFFSKVAWEGDRLKVNADIGASFSNVTVGIVGVGTGMLGAVSGDWLKEETYKTINTEYGSGLASDSVFLDDTGHSWFRSLVSSNGALGSLFKRGLFDDYEEPYLHKIAATNGSIWASIKEYLVDFTGMSVFKTPDNKSVFRDDEGVSYLKRIWQALDMTGFATNALDIDAQTNVWTMSEEVETNYEHEVEDAAAESYSNSIVETTRDMTNHLALMMEAVSNQWRNEDMILNSATAELARVQSALIISPGYIVNQITISLPASPFPALVTIPDYVELKWDERWVVVASFLGYAMTMLIVVGGIVMASKIMGEA